MRARRRRVRRRRRRIAGLMVTKVLLGRGLDADSEVVGEEGWCFWCWIVSCFCLANGFSYGVGRWWERRNLKLTSLIWQHETDSDAKIPRQHVNLCSISHRVRHCSTTFVHMPTVHVSDIVKLFLTVHSANNAVLQQSVGLTLSICIEVPFCFWQHRRRSQCFYAFILVYMKVISSRE
jgi:hypothetical protein